MLYVVYIYIYIEWNVDGMVVRGSNLFGLCWVFFVLVSILFGENYFMDFDIREVIVCVVGKSLIWVGVDWFNLYFCLYIVIFSMFVNVYINVILCVLVLLVFFEFRLVF